MKLNKEEKDILDSVERDEWKSVSDLSGEKKRYENLARAMIRKDRRINIRISEKVLIKIQKKALEEGIPYQTYISSILHKFVGGRYIERTG